MNCHGLSIVAGAMLAMLLGVWATASPAGGYLVDSQGHVVRNGYGECWRTGSWTPVQALNECDPDLVVKSAPRAEPAPALHPESGAAAPAPAPAKPGVKAQAGATKNGGGYPGAERAMVPLAASMGLFAKTVNILEHRWTPIFQKGVEGKHFAGYGMYTYVLFGRDPTAPNLDQAIVARYEKTLKAILEQSTPESVRPPAASVKGNINLFCIPANELYLSRLALDRGAYGYQLSQDYLDDFRLLLRQDKVILPALVSNAGPFLIATLKPLGDIVAMDNRRVQIKEPGAPLLLVDLTHTHERVIGEMVDAFKRQTVDKEMKQSERFKSLRVALINLLLEADDQVTPVKQAVAGWLPESSKPQQSPKPLTRQSP